MAEETAKKVVNFYENNVELKNDESRIKARATVYAKDAEGNDTDAVIEYRTCSFPMKVGATLAETVKLFGEKYVHELALGKLIVNVQNFARSLMANGNLDKLKALPTEFNKDYSLKGEPVNKDTIVDVFGKLSIEDQKIALTKQLKALNVSDAEITKMVEKACAGKK